MALNHVSNMEQLRRDLEAALEPVKEKYGMTSLILGTIRYDNNQFRCKAEFIKVAIVNASIGNISINPITDPGIDIGEMIGRTFNSGGKEWIIVDYKPRNWKMPIIAVESNKMDTPGALRYKFPSKVLSRL
jgi:hypothetical protein